MKRFAVVCSIGVGMGLLDTIPLIPAGAPAINMVAIGVFWVVTALMMAKTRFVRNNLIDGLLMAVTLMLPLILTVSAVNPRGFLPMLSMAVILGPICAVLLSKLQLRERV